MNIAALPSAAPALQMMRTPEASERSGPDHDGDADDKGISVSATVSAPPRVGIGSAVDVKA